MAGNVTLPLTGSGDSTAVAASDEVSGVHYPIAKLADGASGSVTPIMAGGGTEEHALRVTIASDSTGVVSVDDNGGSLTVDGTITANAGTDLNTSALALESGGNLAAAAASLAVIDDWDESDRARVNTIVGQSGVQGGSGVVTASTQRVVLATDVALPAGSNTIGRLAANSGVDIGDVDVTSLPGIAGDVAHDDVDSGNPVGIGGIARTANPTPVAALDRVKAWFTPHGKQVVQIGAPRELVVTQHTQIASSSSETTILSAGGAGVYHDITAMTITNQSSTAVNVTIRDSTGGTTRMIIALPAAAGGGWAQSFPVPIPQGSAAGAWTAQLSVATATVNIFVQAIKTT